MRAIDLTGHRFGMLTVVSFSERIGGQAYWNCICDCGNACIKALGNLRSGHTKSCGCFRSISTTEEKTKHGYCGTLTYRSWVSMKTRCLDEKNHKYPDYGGRGIKLCKEWESFEQFLKDMGERPEGTTLGRINNDGDYEPSNCEWQTAVSQARNKRNTALFMFQGINATIPEHCERLGLNASTVRSRIYTYGWSIEKSLSTK